MRDSDVSKVRRRASWVRVGVRMLEYGLKTIISSCSHHVYIIFYSLCFRNDTSYTLHYYYVNSQVS